MNNTKTFVKNNWVEALRALLIFYIAYHHFSCRYTDFYPEFSFGYSSEVGGMVGNFMFMMISGYFLAKTLLKGWGLKKLGKYCINRWWRLFPAVVVCTTITYIVIAISPLNDRMVNFSQYVLNFLIIHPGVPYVDGSHWFVAALLQMQLLLGILLLVKDVAIRVKCIVTLFFLSLVLYLLFDLPQTRIDNVLYHLTHSSWLPVLLSGCIIFYVQSNLLHRIFYLVPIGMVLIHIYGFNDWIVLLPFCLFIIFTLDKIKAKCPVLLAKWGGGKFLLVFIASEYRVLYYQ